ncbi:hypothetical protein ACX93W_05215 [Paenibacillus sp. CAU 1782]
MEQKPKRGSNKEPTLTEREVQLKLLVEEKIEIATALGLMIIAVPDDESYKYTDKYKRLQEIDRLLWGLI